MSAVTLLARGLAAECWANHYLEVPTHLPEKLDTES